MESFSQLAPGRFQRNGAHSSRALWYCRSTKKINLSCSHGLLLNLVLMIIGTVEDTTLHFGKFEKQHTIYHPTPSTPSFGFVNAIRQVANFSFQLVQCLGSFFHHGTRHRFRLCLCFALGLRLGLRGGLRRS